MAYKSILRGLWKLSGTSSRFEPRGRLKQAGATRRRVIFEGVRIAFAVFFLLTARAAFAQTLTPNIGLQVPNFNQPNWQVPLNYDLNRLDLLLSGNLPLPFLNPSLFQYKAQLYAGLPACSSGTNGMTAAITDATTTIWGNAVFGGGGFFAWVYCNGSSWLVQPYAGGTGNGSFSNPMTTQGDMIYQSLGVPARLPVGTLGQCLVSDGTNPIWGSCAGFTTTVWSSLTSPISDTFISMSGWLTVFSFNTSISGFVWENTDAATSGGGKSSPALLLKGTYWNGSTSQPDIWNTFISEGGGTNGNSIYTYLHTGSSGLAAVQVPHLIDTSTTLYGVMIGGGAGTQETSISPGLAGQILTSNGAGSPPSFQPPATITTATLTMNAPKLKEINAVDTLVSVANASGGSTVYTGTFPNCSTSNSLVGGWYAIASFVNSANNGTFGPASACTSTTLTVPNASGSAETHAGTATNFGFQLVAAQGAGTIIIPETAVFRYVYGGTPFTLGNSDNVFNFQTSSSTSWNTNISAVGTVDQSADEQSIVYVGVSLSPGGNAVNTPIIVGLAGTTPALTAGNGSAQIKLDWAVR